MQFMPKSQQDFLRKIGKIIFEFIAKTILKENK